MEILTLISLGISVYALIKINKIDSQLKNLGQPSAQPSVIQTQLSVSKNTTVSASVISKSVQSQPGSFEKLWSWYAHDWPLKTGALFILLGFVWLVTYAFLNNWVGPMGRIAFGLVSGALILYGGELRLRVVKSQGITLVGLGAAVMTVTIAAAQFLYHLFPAPVALGLLGMTMVLTAVISLRHYQISLATASLVIGGLAPILIGSTEKNIFGLYTYLLVVTIGVLWLARYSKWRILTLLSLVIVALYSLEYFFMKVDSLYSTLTPNDIIQLQFFAITFITIYFMSTLASIVTNRKASLIDLQSAVAVGFFTLGWINGLVSEEYKSLMIVLASIMYALASYGVFIKTQLKEPVYAYTGVATIMLAVATGLAFEGPTLVIAFSLQALLLPIVATSLFGENIGKYLFIYFILPLIFSLEAIVSYHWVESFTIFHEAFYSLSVVTICFLLSGLYFHGKYKDKTTELHKVAILLIVVGSLYGLIWIWKVFHVLFAGTYFARMFIIITYAILGMWSYIIGQSQNRTVIYKFGIGLLIFVVARLLIVEVWDMELPMRIVTFFAIGLLFIGSVLLRKSKEKAA